MKIQNTDGPGAKAIGLCNLHIL